MNEAVRGPVWEVRPTGRRTIEIRLFEVVNVGRKGQFVPKDKVLARYQGVVARNEEPNTVKEVFLYPAALKSHDEDDLDKIREVLRAEFDILNKDIKIIGQDISRSEFQPGWSGGMEIDPFEPGSERWQPRG